MSNKRTTIAMKCTDQQIAMVEALKQQTGMATRSAVLMHALANTYARAFPSYSGKPTPIQAGSTQNVVAVKAQARAMGKQIQSDEEEKVIIESGEHVAKLLSASITGRGEGLKGMGMRVERLDNSPVVSEYAGEFKLVDIPIICTRPLREDKQLQTYLLEKKFRDLDLSAKPEALTKKLTKLAGTFVLAIDRGEAKPKQFSMEVLELLIAVMKENNVDTKELEQTLLENAFMEGYAT